MPTQVQVALGAIIRESNAKVLPCGVFGSFGWSGEAVSASLPATGKKGGKGREDPSLVPVASSSHFLPCLFLHTAP